MLLAGLWLATALLATLSTAFFLRGLTAPGEDAGPFPPVLVLLPIRAADAAELAEARACLAAVARQDYPGPWRLVITVEDASDPAHALAAEADPARVSVVLAGPAEGRAQKVQNLLAALATRRAEEAIVVTLDADTIPPPDWLRELTRSLRRGQAEIASGYRWAVPQAGLAARVGALADRAPATCARIGALAMVWGGSTALTSVAIARLDLPQVWAGAVSDDLALSQAAHAAGLRPWMARRVLVPSPVRHDWPGLLAFGRRQLVLLRLHAPLAWTLLGAGLLVPVLAVGPVAAAALGGSAAATAVLGACIALQQLRAGWRAEAARRVLPEEAAARVMRDLPRDRLLLPLAHLAFVLAFLGSAAGRRVTWRGRRYEVRRRRERRVV